MNYFNFIYRGAHYSITDWDEVFSLEAELLSVVISALSIQNLWLLRTEPVEGSVGSYTSFCWGLSWLLHTLVLTTQLTRIHPCVEDSVDSYTPFCWGLSWLVYIPLCWGLSWLVYSFVLRTQSTRILHCVEDSVDSYAPLCEDSVDSRIPEKRTL